MTYDKVVLATLLKNGVEQLPLNSMMEPNHMSHDKHFFRRLNIMDGTNLSLISGGIVQSMYTSMMDVHDNARKHTFPTLVFIGNKDMIVDNAATQRFFKTIKTPDNLK